MKTPPSAESSIEFRQATLDDIDALSAIEARCFASAWPQSAIAEELNKTSMSYTVVAIRDTLPVGYLLCWIMEDECHILKIAVIPEARRQQIASGMLNRLLQHLSDTVTSVLLEVGSDNIAALTFYAKYGFVKTGVRTGYYRHCAEDAILMTLFRTATERPVRPLIPAALQDTPLRVVAPSGKLDPHALKQGLICLDRFFTVSCDRTEVLSMHGYLAGDDDHRWSSLQRALDSEDAIIAARGGYGVSRLLDRLCIDKVLRHPRWIVGCSDLTALLMHLWCHGGMATIHGPMVATLPRIPVSDVATLHRLLQGQNVSPVPLLPVIPGHASGPLIGGNLTVLAHLCGTLPLDAMNNTLLFIEDVNEAPYKIDRLLVQLRRNGWLDRISGVVIGDFTGCFSTDDPSIMASFFKEMLASLHVPVAMGYPAAHGGRNLPFVHGKTAFLLVEETALLDTRLSN